MKYDFADLSLDTGRRQLSREDEQIKLTKLSFKVLEALVVAAPNMLTHDELVEKVWGPGRVISPENISQRVAMLRQSLGDSSDQPAYVETVYGQGFRLIPEVAKSEPASDSKDNKSKDSHQRPRLAAALVAVLIGFVGWAGFSLFWSSGTPSADNPIGIAVLPFNNIGGSQEDEFFTDGMHHEVMNRLAQISALRVPSQTSVMRYRDSEKTLAEIANELSVSAVLEGGVQRIGDEVRINVQLVDARTDEHIWAQIFTQEYSVERIFRIQSEISKAVASALHAEISPATMAKLEEVPTESLEAYELYLRAVRERSIWRGADMFAAMKPLLERAVAIDPDFLRAQVLLMEANGRLLWVGADPDRIHSAKALELLTDIRRRWPDRTEGHLALGHYYYTVERDYARALIEYQIVAKVNPNDLETLRAQSSCLKRLNRNEEHLQLARRIVELDPGNSLNNGDLVIALSRNGLVEQMLAVLDDGVRRFSDEALWLEDLAFYRLYHLGDSRGFLAYGEQLRDEGHWAHGGHYLTWQLYGSGDVDMALQHAAARVNKDYGWGAAQADTDRALLLRMEGRDEEAQAAADRSLAFVRAWTDAKRPFPTTDTRTWFMSVAYAAAVAGDTDFVAAMRAKADAAEVREPSSEKLIALRSAMIDAILGDADAGWARLEPYLDVINPARTPEIMAVHPLYEYLFGNLAAYQRFIAQAETLDSVALRPLDQVTQD